MTITIDVYADIACPWCYIGARRLQQAIAQRPALTIERRWRPFQLQPQLPPTGVPWRSFAVQKFGGAQRMAAMFDQVARVGAADGLTFNFERVATAANTVDAHRLILFAAQQGRQWVMADALFRAYFADGRNLNDHDHLAQIASQAGLDQESVQHLLAGDALVDEVQRSQITAHEYGVNSVPYYIINDQYALVGAQPGDVWLQVLDMVSGAAQPAARGVDIALHEISRAAMHFRFAAFNVLLKQ